MEVGDLVRYIDDGDVGIIIDIDPDNYGEYHVKWGDGCEGWHRTSDMEVICK
jgi:hypothetical protein